MRNKSGRALSDTTEKAMISLKNNRMSRLKVRGMLIRLAQTIKANDIIVVCRGILRETVVEQRQKINFKSKQNKHTHQHAQKVMVTKDMCCFIDSGTSQHMTNSKDSMVHYQEFSSPEIEWEIFMILKLIEKETYGLK